MQHLSKDLVVTITSDGISPKECYTNQTEDPVGAGNWCWIVFTQTIHICRKSSLWGREKEQWSRKSVKFGNSGRVVWRCIVTDGGRDSTSRTGVGRLFRNIGLGWTNRFLDHVSWNYLLAKFMLIQHWVERSLVIGTRSRTMYFMIHVIWIQTSARTQKNETLFGSTGSRN